MLKKSVKPIIATVIPIILLLLPADSFLMAGLSVLEQRVVAIFVFATLYWVLEPVPIYATSLLIIFLELFLISDKAFLPFQQSVPTEDLLTFQSIMATFASPIILLFLGGFFLAMAATKYRLDVNLARVLLRPFGQQPIYIMMGLMLITAFFSMFMSNTATTAMMLSILAPVLTLFDQGDRGKLAVTLSIPLAANIGGIGTPIGTPPNAIALKYLTGDNLISFSQWMVFAVPYVLVLLVFGWLVLQRLFPISTTKLQLDIKGKFLLNFKAILVYVIFGMTILLWLTDFLHGMNAYVVALIPVALFSALGIITKADLKNISWDVLWLVSGGIALGLALDESGLAANLVNSIPFGDFSPYLIIFSAAVLSVVMGNFISNTATANLLLPIIAALGTSLPGLAGIGGLQMLILCVTIAASLGMSLPISTPPNALAHGTGLFQTKDLATLGIIIGLLGMVLNFSLMAILNLLGFFG